MWKLSNLKQFFALNLFFATILCLDVKGIPPILMYSDLANTSNTVYNLEQQLQWILNYNQTAISLEMLQNSLFTNKTVLPTNSIALSFENPSLLFQYKIIPIIMRLNISAAAFVKSDLINTADQLSEEMIQQIENNTLMKIYSEKSLILINKTSLNASKIINTLPRIQMTGYLNNLTQFANCIQNQSKFPNECFNDRWNSQIQERTTNQDSSSWSVWKIIAISVLVCSVVTIAVVCWLKKLRKEIHNFIEVKQEDYSFADEL